MHHRRRHSCRLGCQFFHFIRYSCRFHCHFCNIYCPCCRVYRAFCHFQCSFCASFARFCDIQAFLPSAVNPARYMATRRAKTCFVEGDRALQGLHPASSTAASVDNPAATDGAAWFYCRHTLSFVQTSLFTPTSDTVLNVSNGSNVAATSGHSTDGIHCGSGGYCARNKRLMQQDPTFTCLSDTTAGVCVRVFTIVWCRLCRLFGIDWPG